MANKNYKPVDSTAFTEAYPIPGALMQRLRENETEQVNEQRVFLDSFLGDGRRFAPLINSLMHVGRLNISNNVNPETAVFPTDFIGTMIPLTTNAGYRALNFRGVISEYLLGNFATFHVQYGNIAYSYTGRIVRDPAVLGDPFGSAFVPGDAEGLFSPGTPYFLSAPNLFSFQGLWGDLLTPVGQPAVVDVAGPSRNDPWHLKVFTEYNRIFKKNSATGASGHKGRWGIKLINATNEAEFYYFEAQQCRPAYLGPDDPTPADRFTENAVDFLLVNSIWSEGRLPDLLIPRIAAGEFNCEVYSVGQIFQMARTLFGRSRPESLPDRSSYTPGSSANSPQSSSLSTVQDSLLPNRFQTTGRQTTVLCGYRPVIASGDAYLRGVSDELSTLISVVTTRLIRRLRQPDIVPSEPTTQIWERVDLTVDVDSVESVESTNSTLLKVRHIDSVARVTPQPLNRVIFRFPNNSDGMFNLDFYPLEGCEFQTETDYFVFDLFSFLSVSFDYDGTYSFQTKTVTFKNLVDAATGTPITSDYIIFPGV